MSVRSFKITHWILALALIAPATALADGGPTDYVLTLGEQQFDPVRDGVPAVPADLASTRAEGPELRLIQFNGTIAANTVESLEAAGVSVLQYVHPNTYIVWADAGQFGAVSRAASNVRWTGDFLPAYRLLPRYRDLRVDSIRTDIMIVRAADSASVVATIAGLGVKVADPKTMDGVFDVATADVPGALLPTIASLPGVYSVQPQATDGGLRGERTDQICAQNVDPNNIAFTGYSAWLATAGVNGNGVIIANVDGGFQDNHPVLVGRVLPCLGGGSCGGSGTSSSHGTHTAGIMAADGSGNVNDSYGFRRGLGVAPGANLIEQLYSPTYTQPNGMLKLMTDSYRNGASLSGNSWGPSGSPLGYDNNTRQVDVGTRDADPNTPGNQPLLFVLSIMNGNGGTSTQGTPDEAKNIFTVGSTKGQNTDLSQIPQIDDLSSNTAHGPCLDGRKIPHIVAPGCNVDSSIPTSTYGTLCGTSMASPHVSGAAALFIQYYRSLPNYSADPSPALIKAAFCAVAKSLAGHKDANNNTLGQPFDSKQGWGRMLLGPVIKPDVPVRYFDVPTIFTATGQQWTQTVSVFDTSKPVRIMLAWTDAPGAGLGGSTPAWVNDLDLEVTSGVNTFKGNVFSTATGWSVTGGTKDDRNNTEAVFIGPTASGALTITVKAANIVGDGVPNYGGAQDQDFALVCYNCALEPGFTVDVAPGVLQICAPAAQQTQVQIGQLQGFTDPVDLSVNGLPAGVTPQFSVNPVTPPGNSMLTLTASGAAVPGDYSLEVVGTSGALTRSHQLTLRIATAAPAAPALLAPANNATGVSVHPTLSWIASSGAVGYDVQLALDANFQNIVASNTGQAETSFTVPSDLLQGTRYWWHVRALNPCGPGAWSATYAFITRVTPAILLVDDDDNGPDVRAAYTDALAALGVDYDLWDTNDSDNEPTAQFLAPYCYVIWFTGDSFGGTCGPGPAGEAELQTWLGTGKNLLISSQDYFYDRRVSGAPDAFMSNVLGVLSVTNDVDNQTSITGQNAFAGLGPYTLSYPFTNYSDAVTPKSNFGTTIAFAGNSGTAAIARDSGVYKTVYMTVPLEAAPLAARTAILSRALQWFYPCGPTLCAGDVNCDGVVDFADIDAFVEALSYPGGAGWPHPGCPWLNADTNHDQTVDFADIDPFVALIGSACP